MSGATDSRTPENLRVAVFRQAQLRNDVHSRFSAYGCSDATWEFDWFSGLYSVQNHPGTLVWGAPPR